MTALTLDFSTLDFDMGGLEPFTLYRAGERNGGGEYLAYPDGILAYVYHEGEKSIATSLARDFRPKTLKAFKLRLYRFMDSLATLTLPEDRGTMTEAQALRSALRNAKQREQEGKRAKVPLEYIPARVIAKDLETVKDIATEYGHDPSFVVRAAVHMFCEAYRRNPRALDL